MDLYFLMENHWSGWYFSEQLKFANNNGYNVKVVKGYTFSRWKGVFKSYLDSLYQHRSSTSDQTVKNLYKLLLNSLLGWFGMHINKHTTSLVNIDYYQEIATTRTISLEKILNKDTFLLSYSQDIDNEICDQFNIDIVKAQDKIKNYSERDRKSFNNISMPI